MSEATARYQVTAGDRVLTVAVIETDDGLEVQVEDGARLPVRVRRPQDDELHALVVGERTVAALVAGQAEAYIVVMDGEPFDVTVQDERAARLASAAAGRPGTSEATVTAPMPGLVVAVHVEPGQAVAKGTSLVVLQAMKMENELTARDDATVKDVLVSPGQTVDQGQVLVALE